MGAALGNKKAPFIYLGCWRFSADRQRIEITKSHKMDRRTFTTTPEQPESQSIPFSSFKMR
jgi:hypothetical protein